MSSAPISTVLIDDDKSILLALRTLLEQKHGDLIEVVGTAGTVSDGLELMLEVEPELVFLDISMPDGEGFDLLDKLESHHLDFEVIFITAHDQFALKAFDFAALDYILKPFNTDDISNALDRVRRIRQPRELEEKVNIFRQAKNAEYEKIIIPSSEGLHVINIDNIIRLEANDTYTFFFLNDGHKLLASKPLSNFERLLEGLNFQRIHSKNLINLKYIKRYVKGKGGYVIMSDGTEVEVSVRKKAEFLNALKSFARSL